GATFADRAAGDAGELDAVAGGRDRVGEGLLDGRLLVADVPPLHPDDFLGERRRAAYGDLLGAGGGLAFFERAVSLDAALLVDHVLRHVLAADVLRPDVGDVARQLGGEVLERFGGGHEVGLAVDFDQNAEALVEVHVALDHAFVHR